MAEEKNLENEPELVEDDEIVTSEGDDDDSVDTAARGVVKRLREKLKASEEERRKALEDLQRARADFLNSKRRIEEQLVRDRERAADGILIELLSVLDSFDTATADEALWNAVDEKWRAGMEAIHANLRSILRRSGVTEIESLGAHFDPAKHEAVSNIAVTDPEKTDTIISVLQKGYRRGDTILRPAKVVVGTA
ncbi:MAG TPA: nucleotide exchange factor GrpE [Candidatus Paceibacterota bacterium]|nr:nucleotide exchange factor GrpE [Candidatus Paceibacterota bacterium]